MKMHQNAEKDQLREKLNFETTADDEDRDKSIDTNTQKSHGSYFEPEQVDEEYLDEAEEEEMQQNMGADYCRFFVYPLLLI